jgi:hypothetical protein
MFDVFAQLLLWFIISTAILSLVIYLSDKNSLIVVRLLEILNLEQKCAYAHWLSIHASSRPESFFLNIIIESNVDLRM